MVDFIINVDLDGTILHENVLTQSIFKKEKMTSRKNNIYEFIHPDDREKVQTIISGVIQSGTMEKVQVPIQEQRDEWVDYHLIINPVLCEKVQQLVLLGSRLSDVFYEKDFFGHINRCGVVFYSLDLNNCKLTISQSCETISGLQVDHFIQDPRVWKKLVHSEDIEIVEKLHKDSFTKPNAEASYRLIRSDGQIRYLFDRTKQVLDSTNKVTRIEGIVMDITAYKSSGEIAKNKYHTLFYRNNDSIVSISREGIFLDVNKAAEKLSGYQNEEVINHSFISFVSPDQLDKAKHHFTLAKKGEVQSFPTVIINNEGKVIEIYVTLLPVYEQGKVVEIFGVFRRLLNLENHDVTSSLRASKSLFSHYPHAVFLVNTKGECIDANVKAQTICGYRAEELKQMSFIEILHPDDKRWMSERFIRITVYKEVPKTEQIRLIHKNGEEVKLVITAIPIIADDQVTEVCAIVKEGTNQVEWVRTLIECQSSFLQIIENLNFAVFISEINNGEKGKFLHVNKKACELLNYSRMELLEMSYKDIVHTNYVGIREKQIKDILSVGNVFIKTIHVTKFGKSIPVELNSFVSTLNGKEIVLSIAHYIDEHERVQVINNKCHDHDPGRSLKVLMAEMDINSSELADMTGLTAATISNLRTGKVKKPNIETARVIAKALETKIANIWPNIHY